MSREGETGKRATHTLGSGLPLLRVSAVRAQGTIGSIVHLAGPCLPTPPPYLSTETGVFLLVTHSPATLPAAYTLLAPKSTPLTPPHTHRHLEKHPEEKFKKRLHMLILQLEV